MMSSPSQYLATTSHSGTVEPEASDDKQSEDSSSHSSYSRILKSSTLVGGSQAIGLVMGMIRTKALAIILGPLGPHAVGLLGIFTTLSQLVTSLAGLGIGTSGVREISIAHHTGDHERSARVLIALRRTLFVIGLAGGLAMAFSAPWLSQLSFGSSEHTWEIRLLGLAVLITNVSSGQIAILQGRGMLREMALSGVVSAVAATVVSFPIYYFLGVHAVAPSMVICVVLAAISGWWFSRNVRVPRIPQTLRETCRISRSMVNLGLAFLVASLLTALSTLAIQTMIAKEFGSDALGHYAAAFRVSGFFVAFVLSAMATDFFPRLAAVSESPSRMSRLINEQIEVGALLSVPALTGMLCFADWVIPAFYSHSFDEAVPMFRWLIIGCLGRVFSWPLGAVFMAKGESGKLIASEILAAAVHIGGVWVGLHFFGPVGAAVGFFAMYLIYFIALYFTMSRWIQFAFTKELVILTTAVVFVVISAISLSLILPVAGQLSAGCIITAVVSYLALQRLVSLLGPSSVITRKLLLIPGMGFCLRIR
jgi:enterobacterial common antigen flippase